VVRFVAAAAKFLLLQVIIVAIQIHVQTGVVQEQDIGMVAWPEAIVVPPLDELLLQLHLLRVIL